ncbi:MAG: TIGR03915 family putative DNA repair protein [Clostridiales Family XIII bacterium]|jgi:probable DNA metabolism protein|nr:TIGR03915 family putative DNA repair protein [Clostridiales Family XIII bacterium]
MDYLYDGSFDGFLCCVFRHYYREKAEGIFPAARYQSDLLRAHSIVETNEEEAARVYAAIERKISASDMKRIYMVFRSSVPGKETALLRYIRLGFKEGSKIRLLFGNPIVFAVQQAEQRVVKEVHRMCGLVRFSECKPGAGTAERPILYAPMTPDHDIAEFLAPHFCDRFKEEPFIIHDEARAKALVSAAGEWYITDFHDADALTETGAERRYRKLWREYFDVTAIRERNNPACQRRFMPVRYWRNLTEIDPKPLSPD